MAGGFHTEGLMDTLAKQGATVAVLTPKIGQVDPTHRYLDAFAQDPLPLEKIFNGESISMKIECPLSESSNSGVDLRNKIHLAIVLFVLNKLHLRLLSLGEKPRDIKEALVRLVEELKMEVKSLARIPLSVEAVTPNVISIKAKDDNATCLANVNGGSMAISVVRSSPAQLNLDVFIVVVQRAIKYFKRNSLGTIILIPLLETVVLKGLKPALENWLPLAGIDPSGGMVMLAAGLLFSLVHVLALSLRGENVTKSALAKDIVIWTLGGTLFSFLLTLDGGFGWSLCLHSLLNHGVVNQWLKDIPLLGGLLRHVERPFAVGVTNPTSNFQLLTEERRRRNESIAQKTKGRSSVLYLAAGFDLTNVLTTFPDASEVVMVGQKYSAFTADQIRKAMQSGDLLQKTERYRNDVLNNGYGNSIVLEVEENQIYILALELSALGVDPHSIRISSLGEFVFSYSNSNQIPREIKVQFVNAHLGPKSPVDDTGNLLDFGGKRFDGVYFKAGQQLGGVISVMLKQVALHLDNNATLVLNNIRRGSPFSSLRKSVVGVPGFTTGFVCSVWSEDSSYCNEFNVYTIRSNERRIPVVDQSDGVRGPITDPKKLEEEIRKLERELTPMLRFLPQKIGFHARVLEAKKERTRIWYFLAGGELISKCFVTHSGIMSRFMRTEWTAHRKDMRRVLKLNY